MAENLYTDNIITCGGQKLVYRLLLEGFYNTDELIFSRGDSCVIKRATGSVDGQGLEVFSTVYSGVCVLQIGATGETSLDGISYKSGSIVALPYTDIAFATNDVVTVTTLEGRVFTGTIENYQSISWEGIEGTTIWLKKGNDESQS